MKVELLEFRNLTKDKKYKNGKPMYKLLCDNNKYTLRYLDAKGKHYASLFSDLNTIKKLVKK
jgi:hypothetical protein